LDGGFSGALIKNDSVFCHEYSSTFDAHSIPARSFRLAPWAVAMQSLVFHSRGAAREGSAPRGGHRPCSGFRFTERYGALRALPLDFSRGYGPQVSCTYIGGSNQMGGERPPSLQCFSTVRALISISKGWRFGRMVGAWGESPRADGSSGSVALGYACARTPSPLRSRWRSELMAHLSSSRCAPPATMSNSPRDSSSAKA